MSPENAPKTPFDTILEPDAPAEAGRIAAEPGIEAFVQQNSGAALNVTGASFSMAWLGQGT